MALPVLPSKCILKHLRWLTIDAGTSTAGFSTFFALLVCPKLEALKLYSGSLPIYLPVENEAIFISLSPIFRLL